jgi:hypothetical protein
MVVTKRAKGGAPKGNQNAVGNNGGAPEIYTQEWLENEAKLLIDWFEVPRNIWLKGFALQRGYDPGRLEEFADKSVVFSLALKKAKSIQEFKLVDKGLFNETNSNITKFVLANNHGWTEKQQISGDASSPVGFLMTKVDGDSKDLVHVKVE